METANEIPTTTKQYKNKQIQLPAGTSNCEIRTDANLFSACDPGPSHASCSQNYGNQTINPSLLGGQPEQGFFRKQMYIPVDPNRTTGLDRRNIGRGKPEMRGIEHSYQYVSPPRKKRKKENQINEYVINYSEAPSVQSSAKIVEISREVLGEIYDKASAPETLQTSADARVEEVMKAAKSLFSKRTRTLYHWMHPNAPKQQIKAAVSASWECLGTQEKQFYVSQVLGRFGFPQCNLMVNPQLGGIRELPPMPDMTDFNNISTDELQNAISSISTDASVFLSESTYPNNFPQLGRKKRLGRPPGSRNKKSLAEERAKGPIGPDFQDDPELSEELQQFALNLNIP